MYSYSYIASHGLLHTSISVQNGILAILPVIYIGYVVIIASYMLGKQLASYSY